MDEKEGQEKKKKNRRVYRMAICSRATIQQLKKKIRRCPSKRERPNEDKRDT